ncbi:uncharacterized protein LOC106872932 isoform X1 [Octopus bimaculoides]|uniref:oleoyl-[acyl-carrier-protein] hydrolase n=1 Tax=Octopus bimaculoides TaxID=37653 RepID=A0A0L8H5E6_OCTBM|nr:uncharacterized protein LOC106872932 isoform X1 [Octopus bimaculoides]|eukprot:XP_014775595.1 PREDICTED: uncharacterized protein LOC106872932 isoform X2 [Octopus bimaculoides]
MHPSKTIQIENRQFDSQYVHRILTTCVDIPKVLKQLPPVKRLHLNAATRRSHVSTKDFHCLPDSSSLLTALGELYLLSKNEKFRNVNKDVLPLDSTAPSIGHLVSWDHSFEWPVPSWPQFLIPEKSFLNKTHYITGYFSEYYDAVSILLFETISLITGFNSSIFMQVNMSSELHRDDIEDAEIQVLWHSGRVSVTKNDDIFLFGSFQTNNLFEKFFLDIEEIFLDENIVKYEVLWQNDLLDFMNTIFEYGYSHFRTYLTAVIFNPALHNEGLHRHTFLLAAFELETGICQSGGLVLQFSPPPVVLYLKDVESPKHEDLFVQNMLVYDISKQTHATVLIYSGFHSVTGKANIGISLVLDERFYTRFIEADRQIEQSDLTKVLPYLISYHLLHRVLQLQPGQTLLIHPPFNVLCLFLIEMASAFCKHIYVSSWSLEHSSDLEEMFPGVSSVWGLYLNNKILSLTKGLGCDAAITSGTDINNAFITLADNGKLVLLGIPDPSEYIGMSAFLRNLTLHVTEPFGAVFEFLKQNDSALHSELVNRILNAKSFQFCDGYSLQQSLLFTQLHTGEFETPVRLTKIQNFFESFEDNSEFVSKFADKSWDFLENIKQTLSSYRKIFQSPVTVSCSDKTRLQQSPMTPSIIVTLPESPSLHNEDPPFENVCRNLSQWRKTPKLNRNVPSPLKITSFADEELLVMSPPKPDFSPRIKELMKQGQYNDTLVPLNSLENGEKPLFIVHPVTGNVHALKSLGQMLTMPCFGIRMTNKTPRNSVEDMAEFYICIMEAANPCGPYRLAGYSFGACVAFEMALQLETSNKPVEVLILLDGSPQYFHSHCNYITRELPRDCSTKMFKEFLDIGFILSFISNYKSISQDTKLLIRSSLLKLKDIESKLEWAVKYLFGKPLMSPPSGKKNWLKVYTKLRMKQQPMFSTTTEVLRISRAQKCRDFIQNCHLGYQYDPRKKYHGCIHLLRIKTEPTDSLALPSDYGLSKLCTNVCINYYDGNHQTFLNGISLANDIETLLKERD